MNHHRIQASAWSVVLGLLALLSCAARAQAGPASPAPPDFVDALGIEWPGATVLRPDDFVLTEPGAAWQNQPGATMVYEQVYDDHGAYRLVWDHPDGTYTIRGLASLGRVDVKPNRRYRVSALVRTAFPRARVEINLGLAVIDPDTNWWVAGRREAGLPAATGVGDDGTPPRPGRTPSWERWEWDFVTSASPDVEEGRLTFYVYSEAGGEAIDVLIADLVAIELPQAPVVPFAPGDGVTFDGGAGSLPMAVESAESDGDTIVVRTTGTEWIIDRTANTITGRQRITPERAVARWTADVDLSDLAVASVDERTAVLTGTAATLGVQCDGALVWSPHAGHPVDLQVTSLIDASFVRLARGHLLARDDDGGFAVNPLPPAGSGRLASATPSDPTLDFLGLDEVDTESLSAEPAGWQLTWSLEPGERAFLSVFPPRPYPWAESFDRTWFWTFRDNSIASYAWNRPWVTDWLLWDFSERQWGMSFGDAYVPVDEELLRTHIETIHAQGDRVAPYVSLWFHRTRDPDVFVGEMERWKDTYGIDGFYTDGLPAHDWLAGYVTLRRLRSLFPDGPIVVHDSVPQSGRSLSMFMPFLYTYADFTFMAEGTPTTSGADWAWARYGLSQYGLANCLGDVKGDAWERPEGGLMELDKDLVNLTLGGRSKAGTIGYVETYRPILAELRADWLEFGDNPFYFARHFQPEARARTGFRIGRAPMPILTVTEDGPCAWSIALSVAGDDGATIHYTTDGSDPTADDTVYTGPIVIDADTEVRARSFAAELDPSPVTSSREQIDVQAADLDCDGAVGFGDLLSLLGAWGGTGGRADVDDDGAVGFLDLTLVLAAWMPMP